MSEILNSLEKMDIEIMSIYDELNSLRDETPFEIQTIPNALRKALPGIEKLISDYRDAIVFYNRNDNDNLTKILDKYK